MKPDVRDTVGIYPIIVGTLYMDGWIAFKLLRYFAVAFTAASFVLVAIFCVVTVWLDSMEFDITKAPLTPTELS